jgi:2,4-dienoyl-CoA reductase-like NADH-dependent reductase (Old Yellow Enzyme family)/thioredoxin reductase
MATFTKMFTPGKIGKLEIKNRIFMAPMGTSSYDESGAPTEQTIDYFVERAKGGVGLIDCHAVHGTANLFDDKQIPFMARMSSAIHDAGAKCALQISAPGIFEGAGPSALFSVRTGHTIKEASKEEIRQFVEVVSDIGLRIKQAGFDMVEIHAAHGHLLSSYLSPYTNRRTDEYGGSSENRARTICEMVERIKDKAGPDFPVSVRFNGADFLPGGTTIADALIQARLFEKAGASLLHVSASTEHNHEVEILSYLFPDGYLVDLAARVKKIVKIPVCAVGKLSDPVVANRVLEDGKADFIAEGRALLADPHWANKVKEGRTDEINRCIYCNNCWDRMSVTRKEKRLFCTVNPALFREKEYAIKKTASPKKVIVIGGGLAGMQAAKTAAERGHIVTLYEANGELGGAWNIASAQPGKEIYRNLISHLAGGFKEAGVKVVFNKKADIDLVKAEKPDAVVVATGARPAVLPVPGAGGPNVVQAVDVITGKAKTGDRVVVIGGRMIGMETALYLAEKGKKVSLVTLKRLGENGKKLEETIYRTLRDRMIKNCIQVFPGTPAVEIRPDGVFANDDGRLFWLDADSVVLAVGYKSENGLVEKLKGIVPEIYSIGDCNSPRDGLDATSEGMEAGLKL